MTAGSSTDNIKIIVQRSQSSDSALEGSHKINSISGDLGVQRSFLGEHLPLEIYNVETSAVDTAAVKSAPSQLCEYLLRHDPGES